MVLGTVPTAGLGAALAADAANKAKFEAIHLLIRGFLCTPFLAYGACVVFAMVAAGVPLGAAGLVFPAGYVTLNFLGLEMVTGSFATMPIGVYAGTVTLGQLVRNWFLHLTGNLLGCIFLALLLCFSFPRGGPGRIAHDVLECSGARCDASCSFDDEPQPTVEVLLAARRVDPSPF